MSRKGGQQVSGSTDSNGNAAENASRQSSSPTSTSSTNTANQKQSKAKDSAAGSSQPRGNVAASSNPPALRQHQLIPSICAGSSRVWPIGTAAGHGGTHASAEGMSREELQPIFAGRPLGAATTEEEGSQQSSSSSAEVRSKEEDHQRRENGLSAFSTALNFVKGMLGPGCLSIPMIFRQSGLIMGLALIFLFGLVSSKCMLQLVSCSQFLSRKKKHHFLDYGDVAYEALAQGFVPLRPYKALARLVVNASIVCLQVGICSVSVVFLAAHLREIFEEMFSIQLSQQQWILLVAGPLVLINFIRTLHKIVFLSIIGSVFMFTALAIIFQHLVCADHVPLTELPWFTDLNGAIAASGAVLYAYEGQAMVLPLENKLRDPSQMGGPWGILSCSMAFVSLIYALCGLVGYATYGQKVEGSIALNLPAGQFLFTAVRLMLTAVVFVGFVMQQYVIVEIIWPKLQRLLRRAQNTLSGWEMVFRASLVLFSVSIAYVVPHLERIIPLVGMSAGMLLAIVFPAFLDSLTFLPPEIERGQTRKYVARLVQNSILALIGFFALIGGVEANLMELLFRRHT